VVGYVLDLGPLVVVGEDDGVALAGEPADLLYSRFALHHLPDFWKAVALGRMADMLRPGGALRLWDVAYNFEAVDAERRIEAWISDVTTGDIERGWTRAELAEHVRDEHSTFTWLLEPMIERAGFETIDASYSDSGMSARYLCRKPSSASSDTAAAARDTLSA